MLAVALFYKDMQSYIVNGTGPERLPTEITDPNDSRLSDPDADCQAIGTATLYSCVYQIDRPINGAGGRIQGVELSYQQPIWGGFGVIANYTYSDADSAGGDPIPGNSKDTANLSAYFENQRFSARLSYNYRSAYFVDNDRGRQLYSDDTDSARHVGERQYHRQHRVDLRWHQSARTRSCSITTTTTRRRPARYYDNARTYYAGVRVNFGR